MSAQIQSVNQTRTVNAIAGWPVDVHDESELDQYLTDMCDWYAQLEYGRYAVESDSIENHIHW